jgi:predicted nucleic acid-binding Zn ribbon protein
MERAGRIAGKLKLAAGVADPGVLACAAWKVAAGKKIAGHTRAVSLVRGKLVIEVDDMVWQRQLFSLRHFLLRNLAQEVGDGVVTDLDFRPVPKRRGPQAAQSARPQVVQDDATRIEDPFLRGLYREAVRDKRKQA